MKKNITFLLLITLISCTFIGCGRTAEEAVQSPDNKVSEEKVSSVSKLIKTSPEILVQRDIITGDELDKDGNITAIECFKAIERALGYSTEDIGNISDWYRGDTLAAMDYLDDRTKALLLRMNSNSILEYNEIPLLKPDADITEYEALIYIVRMVGDTYGCTESTLENVDTDKTVLYEAAYKKGLISDTDTSNSDRPITRKEFYNILSKSLFTEYMRGSAGEVDSYRLIDGHMSKNEKPEETASPKELVQLPVSAVINDDLSIEWSLPEQYSHFAAGRGTELTLLSKDGTETMKSMNLGRSRIEPYELIGYLAREVPDSWMALRCNYTDSASDVQYYFDIDISKIKIVTEGEEINPGRYILYKDSWCAKEMSLADGENFETGCYYILKGYENTYRDPKYNTVAYEVFMAEEAANTFIAPTNRSFGVHNYDEVHIQKLTVTGDAEEGFVLSITPESTKGFAVEESSIARW